MTELQRPRVAMHSRNQNDGVPRRRFLAWSSTALLGAVAFGGKLSGLSIEQAFAAAPGGTMGKAVDLGEEDVGILNYAYALNRDPILDGHERQYESHEGPGAAKYRARKAIK